MICKYTLHIYVNIAVEVGKKGNDSSLFLPFFLILSMSHRLSIGSSGMVGGIPF